MAEYLAENSHLRQLSRHYADGQLSFDDYCAARREILNALEAGQLQAEAKIAPESDFMPASDEQSEFAATDIHLPDDSEVFYKTMPPRAQNLATKEPVSSAAEQPELDGYTQILAIVLMVALLIAICALVYVFVL